MPADFDPADQGFRRLRVEVVNGLVRATLSDATPFQECLGEKSWAHHTRTHSGHTLEFINPAQGGAVMPTISAHVRLLPAGFETLPRSATDDTVFVVVEGRGSAEIAGETVPLAERDILMAPSWNAVRFRTEAELVLFGYSDRIAQEKLGLFRERPG